MTEFVGLDLEMAFEEHYHEVLDLLGELFVFIFDGLKTRFAAEIETVKRQYPFPDFQYNPTARKLEYKDAVKLLRENNVEIGDFEDLRYIGILHTRVLLQRCMCITSGHIETSRLFAPAALKRNEY